MRVTIEVFRTIGNARPLAFASEGAVAGKDILPKTVYYGCWGLSGAAVAADITTKAISANIGSLAVKQLKSS